MAQDPTEVQTLIFSKEKFKSADAAKKWAGDHDFGSSGVDETDDSYRIRQGDPGRFKRQSFRTIELEEGVSAVIGKKKDARRVRASLSLTSADVELAADGTPKAFRIWHAGTNPTDHGDTVFSERSAKLLLEEQDRRGNLYSIDVDHLSLSHDAPPEARKSVGWHRVAVRPGQEGPEFWAVDVQWTDAVRNGFGKAPPEWRYFSPAYDIDPDTDEVVSYLNTALTNNPATWAVTALAARKKNVMKKDEIVKALKHMAEGGDDVDPKSVASAVLAMMYEEPEKKTGGPPDGDGDKDHPADKKAAEDDPDAKKDEDKKAAEGEEPKGDADKKAKKSAEDMPAGDGGEKKDAQMLSMAKRLAELERDAETRKSADERKSLLGSRPDIAGETLSWLQKAPLQTVREAVKAIPRVERSERLSGLGDHGVRTATRGASQRGGGALASIPDRLANHRMPRADFIALMTRMGVPVEGEGPRPHFDSRGGLNFPVMTREDVRKRRAEGQKGNAK